MSSSIAKLIQLVVIILQLGVSAIFPLLTYLHMRLCHLCICIYVCVCIQIVRPTKVQQQYVILEMLADNKKARTEPNNKRKRIMIISIGHYCHFLHDNEIENGNILGDKCV